MAKLSRASEESEEFKEFVPSSFPDHGPGRRALPGLDTHAQDLDPRRTAPRLQDPGRARADRCRGVSALPQAAPDADVPGTSAVGWGARRGRRAPGGGHA